LGHAEYIGQTSFILDKFAWMKYTEEVTNMINVSLKPFVGYG